MTAQEQRYRGKPREGQVKRTYGEGVMGGEQKKTRESGGAEFLVGREGFVDHLGKMVLLGEELVVISMTDSHVRKGRSLPAAVSRVTVAARLLRKVRVQFR